MVIKQQSLRKKPFFINLFRGMQKSPVYYHFGFEYIIITTLLTGREGYFSFIIITIKDAKLIIKTSASKIVIRQTPPFLAVT